MAPATAVPAEEKLLNTKQAALSLNVSTGRIRQFVMEGRLPARKVERDLLFRPQDLEPLRSRRAGRPWPAKSPAATRSRRKHAPLRTGKHRPSTVAS